METTISLMLTQYFPEQSICYFQLHNTPITVIIYGGSLALVKLLRNLFTLMKYSSRCFL